VVALVPLHVVAAIVLVVTIRRSFGARVDRQGA